MTKGKIAKQLEALVEKVAIASGATVSDCQIIVGGKKTKSRFAEGGALDLDAARGIVSKALERYEAEIVGYFAELGRAAAAPIPASLTALAGAAGQNEEGEEGEEDGAAAA